MIAVKKSGLSFVREILQSGVEGIKDILLPRDVKGSTPLHVAVRAGNAEIASLLIAAGGGELLHAENGVGETSMEMAYLQWLLDITRQGFRLPNISKLTHHPAGTSTQPVPPYDLAIKSELRKVDRRRRFPSGLANQWETQS